MAALPLPTAAQAAAADAAAQQRHGIPGRLLMENAGRATALILSQLFPEGPIVGVAGSGNNGADTAVTLRTLHAWGRDVTLVAAGNSAPSGELLHGVDIPRFGHGDVPPDLLARAAVILDGLLGTGATGAPRDTAAEWIRRMNGAGRPIVALDLPSGIDATSGAVHETVIRAAVTVTYGWPKLGMLLHPARAQCGRIIAVEIGFPPLDGCSASAITSGWVRERLRPREPVAHKNSVGRLCIVAGTQGMAGAAAIAVTAAFRAGAGLVRVASPASNRQVLQATVPEATFLDSAALEQDDLASMHALVAGPGLGTDAAARASLDQALALTPGMPTLLDADALNILARQPGRLREIAAGRPLVITPHVRELGRLLDEDTETLQGDVAHHALAAAHAFGCVILFKGQPSVIATPDGMLSVGTTGSSDTAKAGMGDQLAGVVGAFLAGGYNPDEAAALGLFISGRAADLAGLGRSLMPGDVSSMLHAAIADPGPARSALPFPFITFDQPPRW